jgi:hypothetical protein
VVAVPTRHVELAGIGHQVDKGRQADRGGTRTVANLSALSNLSVILRFRACALAITARNSVESGLTTVKALEVRSGLKRMEQAQKKPRNDQRAGL